MPRRYTKYPRRRKTAMKKLTSRVNKITRAIERKTHDQAFGATFASDSLVFSITNIAEGSASVQREGLKIAPVKLEVRAKIIFAADGTLNGSPVRMIVFRDNEQAGVLPTIAQLLENADVSSMYNNVNLKRFTILVDKVCQPKSTTTNLVSTYDYCMAKRKLSGTIRYLTDSANQAGQGRGNIYVALVADSPVGGPDTVCDFNSRVTYEDL